MNLLSNNPDHKLTADDLHNLFDANYEEGTLYWKKRDESMFSSKRSYSVWNARFSGKQAFTANHNTGYKHGLIYGKPYLAHRVLFAMKHGEWPKYVDHINGVRTDNRITNLRSVTRTENSCNASKPSSNTSGHIGVSWNNRDKRWVAFISLNKKRKALGNFINIEDAIICRQSHQNALGFHQNHGR